MNVQTLGKTMRASKKESRFGHFWNMRGEWVEEPNVRRGGESGVQRIYGGEGPMLYSKRQTGHTYRSLMYPLGRPTVLRERDAIEGLRQVNVGVPEIVFCGAERDQNNEWRALLVTAALDGFEDLDQWYANGGRERCGELLHERLLKEIGTTLARMHRARWQHSCLYSKHVFVRVSGEGPQAEVEVALLDLEKARRRFTAHGAAQHDMKQFRRHSSFETADWQKLVYFYHSVFGSTIKGLE
ncbi:InaA protein [Pseudomonas cichorii]|nr:InaA protein [Pseudomonas cichorii]MBX8600270.1 InaA protein [Pseudomonas cichorii]MBX8619973.1 InaA protein [Pseudomonas cichorii]